MGDADTAPVPFPHVTDLAGRRAVVTGAAHGIGRSIARALAGQGAIVTAVDKDAPALDEAASELSCAALVGDLGQDDSAVLADELTAKGAVPALVVNNAGTETAHDFLALEQPDFDTVMRTNLRGPWFFTKRLVEFQMEARIRGRFLFISSLHDTHVYGRPHYSATKAAVAMLVRELAYQLGPHGIRVNAISPGDIATAEPRGTLSDPNVPLGRKGVPDDVARMAVALLSDECSGYVTGTNLQVDGGAALHHVWAESGR